MKHYINPEISIFALGTEDVITTSNPVSISNLTDCDYTSWDNISFS
ncbi:MAG: hypothetical protein IJZ80_10535 [Clostridia bacterium]|nr:hypothetical protein [Clostridia bacterium]